MNARFRSPAVALLALTLTLMSCSTGGSSTSSTTPGTAPASDGSTGSSSSTVADADLPPGVQLSSEIALPEGFGAVSADLGTTPLFFGTAPNAAGGQPAPGTRFAPLVGTLVSGSWQVAPMDDMSTYASPAAASAPNVVVSALPTAAAARPGVVVVAGTISFTAGTRVPAVESLLWSSTDGTTWQRFDPRPLVGGNDVSVRIGALVADEHGFFASMTVGAVAGDAHSTLAVLHSVDGTSWQVAGIIAAPWSIESQRLIAADGKLYLLGTEFPCFSGSVYLAGVASFGVDSVWTSADQGSTWKAVDLHGAEPVLHQPSPIPGDPSGCPAGADLNTVLQQFDTQGTVLGLADGHLVALSKDGASTATSTADGATWTVATLPDAVAAGGRGGQAVSASAATLLTNDNGTWVVRSLQPRRDADNTQNSTGCQVWWWRSSDAGVTWTEGRVTRPVTTCSGGFFSFRERSDGSVNLFEIPTPTVPHPIGFFRAGVAGPFVAWDSCTPGPAADCAFVTMAGAGSTSATAADWSGIDLYGATLTDVHLAGANFAAAKLTGAHLSGDLSRANLRDALLYDASIDAVLTGADLTGAQLYQTTFHGDLTGATFGTAQLGTSVTFLAGTTCPDGQPATSEPGAAACRMG